MGDNHRTVLEYSDNRMLECTRASRYRGEQCIYLLVCITWLQEVVVIRLCTGRSGCTLSRTRNYKTIKKFTVMMHNM